MQADKPERLLRLRDVQARVPLGRTTLYNKMRRGEFPKPVSLGGNAVAWVESEVQADLGGLATKVMRMAENPSLTGSN